MKAGNTTYSSLADLPDCVPIFPLSGALLLPAANMPLNVFEPRYLAMVEDALDSHKLIAMVQPRFDQDNEEEIPSLCDVGCLGRITAY